MACELKLFPEGIGYPNEDASQFFPSLYGYVSLDLLKVGEMFPLVESIARTAKGNLIGYVRSDNASTAHTSKLNILGSNDGFTFRSFPLIRIQTLTAKIYYSLEQGKFTSIDFVQVPGVYLLGSVLTTFQGTSAIPTERLTHRISLSCPDLIKLLMLNYW